MSDTPATETKPTNPAREVLLTLLADSHRWEEIPDEGGAYYYSFMIPGDTLAECLRIAGIDIPYGKSPADALEAELDAAMGIGSEDAVEIDPTHEAEVEGVMP